MPNEWNASGRRSDGLESELTVWQVRLSCGCSQEVVTNGWDDYPDDHQYPDPVTGNRLPLGELWCWNDHGDKASFRDVVEWVHRRVVEIPADPLEPPTRIDAATWDRVREPRPYSCAFWTVLLSCGHFASSVSSEIDWDCEDGPMYASASQLTKVRRAYEQHWATKGEDAWPEEGPERDHIRRMLDLGWPKPETETECWSCAHARQIVGYRRIH